MSAGTSTLPLRPRLRRARRRTIAAVRLTWARGSLRLLELASPAAADRKALDLWCALPERRSGKDHRRTTGVVHRLAVPRGGTVVAEVWGDGPVVYLVHGWGGWRGQLGAFVAPLVEAGYRVVAADAPSHGDSEDGFLGTRRGTVMEMIETLEVVGREFGPGVGVVAHSLGCTVAGQVVAGGLQVERLVLIAPNHGFQDVLDQFVRVLRLSRRTADHLRDELEGITQRPLSAFDLDALGADGSMPDTLVVHDRADKETPYQVGAALAEAWPNACLVSTDGLGHQRILADAETVAITVGHITERVPAPERSRTQR